MSEKPDTSQYRRGDYAREKGEIVLREHEYDGIQEFDQKLPNWWLFTFYGAIVLFVFIWLLYYNAGAVPSDQKKIQAAIAQVNEKKAAALAETVASLDDTKLVHEWAANDTVVAEGEAIYLQVCIAYHGPKLDAPLKLGRSLVDQEWAYGGRPMEIFALINDGTPADGKGMEPSGARMMPFGQTYTPTQIAQVTAYIISKNPEEFAKY